jgi:hypothetical protein
MKPIPETTSRRPAASKPPFSPNCARPTAGPERSATTAPGTGAAIDRMEAKGWLVNHGDDWRVGQSAP